MVVFRFHSGSFARVCRLVSYEVENRGLSDVVSGSEACLRQGEVNDALSR